MGRFIDRSGIRYGNLIVVRRADIGPASAGRRVKWECICDCGETATVSGHELQSGDTTSCGCAHRLRAKHLRRTHGKSASPTHMSWRAMKERCLNPSHWKYDEYGGRGIQICERWLSFENFASDMGDRPSKMTLDRIDPDGNYEPGNCRWASAKTQAENRRGVGHDWKGMKRTVADIARLEGLPRTSLQKRLKSHGEDISTAVAHCIRFKK